MLPYKKIEKESAAAGFHIRTGAECNPGACYAWLGIEDHEVEQLGGVKEGCDDPYEFISVQRRKSDIEEGKIVQGRVEREEDWSKTVVRLLPQETKTSSGGKKDDNDELEWVDIPLGTVRVSLGWWSCFDDCEAFSNFIKQNYAH